jgi:hypothetical protein
MVLCALGAGVVAMPDLSHAAEPRPFSGDVCSLLPKSKIPSEVKGGCHRLATDHSVPSEPDYRAVVGDGDFTKFTKTTRAFLITVSRAKTADSLSEFKDIVSTLATINDSKVEVVKVGTWAREVRYPGKGGAIFEELTFISNGYTCTELWANSVSLAERLAAARAVAASLV